jgi:hypothetical protein
MAASKKKKRKKRKEAAQPLANQAAIGAATRAFSDMAKTDAKTRREKSS